MNYKFLFILLVIGLNNCFAQEKPLKFDDIFQSLPSLKPTQSLYLLLKYQEQDPQFSANYVQIGEVCEKQMAKIDPLRENYRAMFWVKNACLYYASYETFAEKGEVNRNREYYENIDIPVSDKKLKDEDVLRYVKARLDYCNKYKNNITKIFNDLELAKENYSNAILRFNELNVTYKNQNDLLLHMDDALLLYLDSLKDDFVTAKEKFKDYKSNLEGYPIGDYHQKYTLKDIETFRLDGLTKSDFMANSFFVWDFNSWVEKQKETYRKDIVSLRKEVVSIQEDFNKNRTFLMEMDTIPGDEQFSSYTDLFLFRLGRYDHNSIIKNLFQYLSAKQQLMVLGDRPVSSGDDEDLGLMNIKLRYYYNLSQLHQHVKASSDILNQEVSKDKVSRFKDFFSTYYDGYSGFKDYLQNEPNDVNQYMNKCFVKLNRYLQNVALYKMNFDAVKYKKDSIALYVNNHSTETVKSNGYVTEDVAYYRGLPVFVSGYYRKGDLLKPFMAHVDTNHVNWLHFPVKNVDSEYKLKDMNVYTNGCVTVSSAVNNGFDSKVFNYDLKGNLIFTKNVEQYSNPIAVKYDELEKEYAIVFGEEIDSINESVNLKCYNSFNVLLIDSLGNEICTASIKQKGAYVDLIKLGNNYQLYVNSIQTQQKLTGENSGGSVPYKFNLAIASINKSGQILSLNFITDTKSYVMNKVYQISNNQINLIGNRNDGSSNKLVYLIVSDDGKLEYSNMPGR